MYSQVIELIEYIKICYPDYFNDKKVLDVGVLLNNTQNYFTDCEYYITDVTLNDNVSKRDILSVKDLEFDDEYFDTIICIECLEHDLNWKEGIQNIKKMLKENGLLIFILEPVKNDKNTDILDIFNLNNEINFDKFFIYWDCYLDNNTNYCFLLGIKKNTSNTKILIPTIKYSNSISRLKNSNISLLTNKIYLHNVGNNNNLD
tara:strand:+ start:10250 stop:10858 length:609 start_codon:yes stop_codon:yes gene_type:complete